MSEEYCKCTIRICIDYICQDCLKPLNAQGLVRHQEHVIDEQADHIAELEAQLAQEKGE